ncbi:VCBS repeat-containing protein, partial [bacterium]|nr:VCBS repeat-containing protein [bacterium]
MRNSILILISVLLFFGANSAYSQQFTELTGGSLTGVSSGSVAWGDIDNDNDLDLVISGRTAVKIYRNDGTTFSGVSLDLPEMDNTSVDWGDYDNDGDIDLLITGEFIGEYQGSSAPFNQLTKIYKNIDGQFSDSDISLPKVYGGSAKFGDCDNDGDLDIILTGGINITSYEGFTKLLKNNNGNFSQTDDYFQPLKNSCVDWGDYDNDGDLDILLSGMEQQYTYGKTYIYRNQGGQFSQISSNIDGAHSGTAKWGDYDSDGDLDVLIVGDKGSHNYISKVYRNDSGSFVDINANLPGLYDGSADWGDYDNDGDLDFMMAGSTELGNSNTKLYRNDSGIFNEVASGLSSASYSAQEFGDYDNDGDLDVLLTGGFSQIYRNNNLTLNTIPSPPSGLIASVVDSNTTLSWDKSTDAETPQNGLTYNLRVGTTPDGCERKSPMADCSSGYRKVVQLGNVNHCTSYTIKELPEGKYYWSVQAIDNAFAGSAWAVEDSFTINITPPNAPGNLTATPGNQQITLRWDANTESDLHKYNIYRDTSSPATTLIDSVVGSPPDTFYVDNELTNGQVYYYRITAVDEAGNESGFSNEVSAIPEQFTEQTGISLTGVIESSVAWGDYDNDGDLDILLSGFSSGSKIYRNNDNNSFTEQTGISLTGVSYSSVAWGDYDNDGDLDILLTGNTGSSYVSKIYRNNGNNSFSEQTGIILTGIEVGSVAWGDYDNDGDLDILLTGSSSGYISKIYRNNSDDSFTEQTGISLTGVYNGSVAWGDYDNDGDLDILLTGWTGSTRVSKIYRNNGDNSFTEQTGISLTGVYMSSVAWGDYDNDGDLDILLTGASSSEWISKIYRNNGDDSFTEQTGISLIGIHIGSVAWGDYDNDGDLDILLTGQSGSSTYVSRIYRNNNLTPNSVPTAPSGLTTSVTDSNATFSWNKSTDTETPQNGLTYNLYVSTTPGSCQVKSPMADISSGYRKVVQLGNMNHCNSYILKSIPDGKYYWSVQAIDNAFAGSSWAAEDSFKIDTTPPTAPQNIAVTPDNQQITLRWSQNSESDLAKYRIYRDTSSPATTLIDSVVGTPPDTFSIDGGLTNGQTYYYRITAVDIAWNESEYSNEIQIAPIGLMGYYPFNENANDESGCGNNGQESLTTFTFDRFGNDNSACLFNGIDSYVDVRGTNYQTLGNPWRDFSFSFWIKHNVTSVIQDYIGKQSSSSQKTFRIFRNKDDKLEISLSLNGVDSSSFISTINYSYSEWSHIVLTRNSQTGLVKIYQNGLYIEDSGNFFDSMIGDLFESDQSSLVFGRLNYSVPLNTLNGVLDDIYIYNKVVSDTDIDSLYHLNGWPIVSPPQNLTATPGNQQITLRWDANSESDLAKYRIYRDTLSPATTLIDSLVGTLPDTVYIDTGLTNGQTYYYRITAVDDDGNESGFSDEVSTTPSSFLGQVRVVGGTFQMGSTTGEDNETPVHSVTIGSFYIDRTEITYEKWIDVQSWGLMYGYTDLSAGQNGYIPSGTNNPVTAVNWYDIVKWCNARSEKEGSTPVYYTDNTLADVYRMGQLDLAADAVKWTANGYRLPTEAEWEFAARGGTSSKGYTYSGSNNIDSVAWCSANSGNTTHSVSTKGANELGLYDMSGNVWEWCWDWYDDYVASAQIDPKGSSSGTSRTVRGGMFYDPGYYPNFGTNGCRVAHRYNGPPYGASNFHGFRCVITDSISSVSYFPAPPQNLTTQSGNQQITLRWNKNTESDFLCYRIYGGTSANP